MADKKPDSEESIPVRECPVVFPGDPDWDIVQKAEDTFDPDEPPRGAVRDRRKAKE